MLCSKVSCNWPACAADTFFLQEFPKVVSLRVTVPSTLRTQREGCQCNNEGEAQWKVGRIDSLFRDQKILSKPFTYSFIFETWTNTIQALHQNYLQLWGVGENSITCARNQKGARKSKKLDSKYYSINKMTASLTTQTCIWLHYFK